jgi:hypothetical protein
MVVAQTAVWLHFDQLRRFISGQRRGMENPASRRLFTAAGHAAQVLQL